MTSPVPAAEPAWWTPGDISMFRWARSDSPYRIEAPWNTPHGRFDDGRRLTLYLAASAEVAMAEFFRRNPEFLAYQNQLNIRLVRLDVTVNGECLDVRDAAKASVAEIDFDRLRSSDDDEGVRYAECRQLADEVEAVDGVGIGYPSAAYRRDGWNLVAFGAPNGGWRSRSATEVTPPAMDAADVEVL